MTNKPAKSWSQHLRSFAAFPLPFLVMLLGMLAAARHMAEPAFVQDWSVVAKAFALFAGLTALFAGLLVLLVCVIVGHAVAGTLLERAAKEPSPDFARRLRLRAHLVNALSSAGPLVFMTGYGIDGLRDLWTSLAGPLIAVFGVIIFVASLMSAAIYARRDSKKNATTSRFAAFYALFCVTLLLIFALPIGLDVLGAPRWSQLAMQYVAFTALFFANDTYFKLNVALPKAGSRT